MPSPAVLFDANRACLVFGDETEVAMVPPWPMLVAARRVVENVPLADLEPAMRSFAEIDPQASYLEMAETDHASGREFPGGEAALVYDDERGIHALALTDLFLDEDGEWEDRLEQIVTPLAERWDAEAIGTGLDGLSSLRLGVRLRLRDQHRRVGELLTLAEHAIALVTAVRERPLSPQVARDLLAAGYGRALEGLAEGSWIDVKRQPYDAGTARGSNRAAWEMSKDVAAFANAKGGIIVIPGTERTEHGRDVIERIGEMPLEQINIQRIRNVLAEHVYPVVEDLEIDAVETSPGHGVLWILIPDQPEQIKPFLVRGTLDDDKVITTHISLPRRVGAHTRHSPIAEIHAQLVAGRGRRLGREEILDLVRRDQLPWGFRELVEGAEAAGISTVLGNGAMRFETSDGRTFESQYGQLPDGLLHHEVSRLCAELAPYGLEVATAPTGQLLPRRLVG